MRPFHHQAEFKTELWEGLLMDNSSISDAYNSHIAVILRKLLERSPKTGERTTYKTLAEHLSVKQQSVSSWVNGTTIPSVTHIAPIAQYFGVSCDFLLGVNDTHTHVENDVRKSTGLTIGATSLLVNAKNQLDANKNISLTFERDRWLSGKIEVLSFVIEHGFKPNGFLEALYFYLIPDYTLDESVVFPTLEAFKADCGAPSDATMRGKNGKDIPVISQMDGKTDIRFLDLNKLISHELRENVLKGIKKLKVIADEAYDK